MNITINAVKFKPDGKLEQFVHERVKKIGKNLNNVIGCDVTLKVDKPEADNNKITEIQMHLPGHTMFSSKQAGTFEESTSLAIDAIKAQIEKLKKAKSNTSRSEMSNYLNDEDDRLQEE